MVFSALLASSLLGPWEGVGGKQRGISGDIVFGMVLVIYLVTAFSLLSMRRRNYRLELHLQTQIVVDIMAALVLVYLTGGVESPFSFFFALPVIVAAVFYTRRGTMLTAVLACLVLMAEFVLESRGVLPLDLEGRIGGLPSFGRVVYLLGLNFAMILSVGWLAGTLSEQARKTGRALERTKIDLRRLEALHKDIVSSLLSGLVVVDSDMRTGLVNPVAGKILGIGDRAPEDVHLAELSPELAELMHDHPEGEVVSTEITIQRNGRSMPLGVTVSPLRDSNGNPIGNLIHMQDLTDKKRLERQKQQAERLAAIGQMAAGLAHELRNPLASISGSVQMLGKGVLRTEDAARLSEIVMKETKRLDDLLKDFLAFARPKQPVFSKCRLDTLVEETLAVFRNSPTGTSIDVTARLEPCTVAADPDQMKQVIWNLLANAAEAAGKDGLVTVSLHDDAAEGRVVLEVGDNAEPIPEEVRTRLFEPFFTTKPDGTGLGLAVAKRIIDSHGGTIEVHATKEGNRFLVILPEREDGQDTGGGRRTVNAADA